MFFRAKSKSREQIHSILELIVKSKKLVELSKPKLELKLSSIHTLIYLLLWVSTIKRDNLCPTN